jgi:hypothetical protein
MSNAQKCPVCLQILPDPSAVARVKHNLEKLDAQREAAFERRLDAARRAAKRKAEASARKAYASKMTAAIDAVVARTRQEESRKTDRFREQLTKQNEELRRKLERMTADERGEVAEAEIQRALQNAFPGDIIKRLGKSRGSADIRHDVREQGRTCGVIVYEVKNVADWKGDYIKQARKSLALHEAAQAVLVSTAFPSGQKYLTFEKDVAVVHPAIVASVVRSLRQVIVIRAAANGGNAERSGRADQLFQFIKGDEFRRSMKAVADSVADLQQLQTREQQQHDRVWTAQGDFYRSIERNQNGIDGRIAQILTGTHWLFSRAKAKNRALPEPANYSLQLSKARGKRLAGR